jgi:hypothetical protein
MRGAGRNETLITGVKRTGEEVTAEEREARFNLGQEEEVGKRDRGMAMMDIDHATT